MPSAAPIPSVRSREDSPPCCEFLNRYHLRQAEVENLGRASFGYEDVCRLNVAVDDALLMRRFQRVGDVDSDGGHPIDGKRTLLNQLLQRFAVEELHGDEGSTTFFGDLINGAYIGMV